MLPFRRDTPSIPRRRMLGLTGGAALVGLGVTACSSASGSGSSAGSATPARSASPPASASTSVSAPPAQGVLAANYNQALDTVDFAELQAVSATWLRGFYVMPDADQGDLTGQPTVQKLLAAVDRGYGTVLSLKFPYDKGLPEAGSPEMQTALDRLDKVLAAVMGKVDILTVGNEPFFESGADRDTSRINEFYEALAAHTVQYRQAHGGPGCRTQIYMGALTALDLPSSRTAQTRRWMRFVAQNRSIAGVDIHPHLPDPAAGQDYLDYVLPYLRADQHFLATEFSLVLLWKAHLTDPVAPGFAAQYGFRHGTPVWQVLKDATAQPFSQQKWNDFLASCPWFQAHRDFLTNQTAKFRATRKLAVAGYGITQDKTMATNISAHTDPWVLNSLFCPYTVQAASDGLPGRNLTWSEEFRTAQSG